MKTGASIMCQVYMNASCSRAALKSQEGTAPSERLLGKCQLSIPINQKIKAIVIKQLSIYFLNCRTIPVLRATCLQQPREVVKFNRRHSYFEEVLCLKPQRGKLFNLMDPQQKQSPVFTAECLVFFFLSTKIN